MTDANITQLLDCIVAKTGDKTSVGEILASLGTRSYGPAFMLIALISMLPPISVTPGLAIVTGLLFTVLSAQLVFLRPYPWVPRAILRVTFSREQLTKTVDRARTWTQRLGRIIGPRLCFLLRPPFLNVIALVCLGLALLVFPLSILPGGENVPAAAIFIFGLALMADDGLLALIGLLATAVTIAAVIWFWPLLWRTSISLLQALGIV